MYSPTRLLRAGRETGFGGGVLIFALDTQKFLWIRRSAYGDHAGTWCCPGGGIEDHETIDEGVHRECREEIGYDEPMELQHMNRDVQPGFIYHNHYAEVDHQFTPTLNEEHDAYQWSAKPPSPLHPRFKAAIKEWTNRNAGA